MEPRADIERRQLAAHRWLEVYAGKTRNGPPGHSTAAERALAVIVLTHKTGDYLAEHDPQALKQAQERWTEPPGWIIPAKTLRKAAFHDLKSETNPTQVRHIKDEPDGEQSGLLPTFHENCYGPKSTFSTPI